MAERRQANILTFFTDITNLVRKRPLEEEGEASQPKQDKVDSLDCHESDCDSNNDVDTSQSRDIYYDDDDNQDDDRGNVCHEEEVLVNNCKESNRTNSESEATLNLQKVRAQTKRLSSQRKEKDI